METDNQDTLTPEAATGESPSEAGETLTPKRRRSGARGRAPAAGNGGTNEGRGNVGRQIYAEVNRIIAAAGISKQDAFARVGEAQGRQTGTVAANYYRVARREGGARVASRARRASGRGRGRRRRQGSDVGAVITQLRSALNELGRAIQEQDREIARL